ncbi:hypothetical protein MB02_00510 [Croceicoccus estronivorus]|uniref:hypothetical protein n=1 Tax=Croceicoccus estronivorus TaxID=1172626 RepID=UPI000834F173|nr:hypothetical protein [Croceicoccus estronivorus]OCC25206.1 hypothetical protein MB02_00510 [Croceicoccus estronivorus]
MARRSLKLAIASLVLVLAMAAGGLALSGSSRDKPELGLFTSLPIYWAEADDVGALLSSRDDPHWVRSALERDFVLKPIDRLDGGENAGEQGNALTSLHYLILAQPRALSPAENVALDAWVRSGGRLLLFADPMLTGHSEFSIGDRRRPQDVVLLSPILSHWGLELQFDFAQPAGERQAALYDAEVPVDLPGQFVLRGGSEGVSCALGEQGLAAECAIGKGHAVILADAALLDGDAPNPAQRTKALSTVIQRAFGGR